MAEVFSRIVFMQGDDADEVLAILDDQGEEAAVEHLAQWHFPGEHETANEPAAGTDDDTFETDDGFILSWNTRLGYIGLEYRTTES
jgi:hypothetical protein